MAQDMTKMLKSLNQLIALDYYAVNAYESAIKRIDDAWIRTRLREYQTDHECHIRDLARCVINYGGAPRRYPDVKGVLIQVSTAVMSMIGDRAALVAMKSHEQLTNETYDEALSHAWPAAVRTIIERNREDERRHLEFVEAQLEAMTPRRAELAAP